MILINTFALPTLASWLTALRTLNITTAPFSPKSAPRGFSYLRIIFRFVRGYILVGSIIISITNNMVKNYLSTLFNYVLQLN